MSADAPQALGGTAIKPEGWDRTGWEAFRYILYDPSTGAVLTRTPLSWLKITVFYLIYYTFLTGFWIACLVIFFQTLPAAEDGPRWQQDYALIGNNPGVGLRPRNSDYRIDSQMFILQDGDTNTHISEPEGEGDVNADYAERVRIFFKAYEKDTSVGYKKFDPESLGFCGEDNFGYVGDSVTPCIFVKLNNIWGWKPRAIECGDPTKLSEEDGEPLDECPQTLLDHLNSPLVSEAGPDNIWIDCNGRNAADKEALAGGMEYFPKSRALPMDYFPYGGRRDQDTNGTTGYHSPLVGVKLSPNVLGQLIHIECRAYFRGVIHSKKDKMGLVQFEVQINKAP